MPKKMSKHTVTITWGGVQIPNSPYRVSRKSRDHNCIIVFLKEPFSSEQMRNNNSWHFFLVRQIE